MTDRNDGVTRQPVNGADEARDGERRRVAEGMAAQLRGRGVRLFDRESGEELGDLLEAVEQFEDVVEGSGGDLMIDEPVGYASPVAPDNAEFVLPTRNPNESVATFIGRIAEAAVRAGRVGGPTTSHRPDIVRDTREQSRSLNHAESPARPSRAPLGH